MAGQKTPVTLSAAERQAQLTREGKIPPAAEPLAGARPSYTPDEVRARLSAGRQEEFAAAAARNLVPEHRFPRAATGLKPDDEFDGATMTLESSKIKPYDRNPRCSINPNYEEIKEAIKVKGVLNQITVTRRPGMYGYMVYGGGNTRLKIVQELDVEYPGNALYSHMKVVYRSWRGESDVIAAHLIENEARGDTTFWDKANGLRSLKKELETELGTTLSSNDVRIKAVALGWKVSRDTVQLYEFAVESLSEIGPWLKFNGARQIKERIGALSAAMKQLDPHSGPSAFSSLLADELSTHAANLKSSLEHHGVGPALVEADPVLVCTALEERVATATGTSVPELRQMLAILATNPQISAAHLRAEAAKGVVARIPQKPAAAPSPGVPANQIPLPTPMLAAVRPPTLTEPAAATLNSSDLASGLPSIQDQGDLPPELSAGVEAGSAPAGSGIEATPVADPRHAAVQAAHALLDALRHLAASTYNTVLFIEAPNMPLGYFMELPQGTLALQADSPMPPDQQARLMRAGWQLLATLSCQFDKRCCNERFLPESSRWLQAVRSGALADGLWDCGITVDDGRIQLDADCLFYVLSEPRLLSPAVLQVLSTLAIRRGTLANVLPPFLELVTGDAAVAA